MRIPQSFLFVSISAVMAISSIARAQITSAGSIKGHLGGVKKLDDGRVRLWGWACQENVNESINVHVYVGGRAGLGKILLGKTANRASSEAISNICNTTVGHRYSITLSASVARQYAGETLHVHGIRKQPGTSSNLELVKSGKFIIPADLPIVDILDDGSRTYLNVYDQSGDPIFSERTNELQDYGDFDPIMVGNIPGLRGLNVALVNNDLSEAFMVRIDGSRVFKSNAVELAMPLQESDLDNVETEIEDNASFVILGQTAIEYDGESLQEVFEVAAEGEIQTLTCSTDQHMENDSCMPNTRACNVTNGGGVQHWDGSWGSCQIQFCNEYFYYIPKLNVCFFGPPQGEGDTGGYGPGQYAGTLSSGDSQNSIQKSITPSQWAKSLGIKPGVLTYPEVDAIMERRN